MTALEAIVMAEHLLRLNDKYEIAKQLLQMELEAEKRGVHDMAADMIESITNNA